MPTRTRRVAAGVLAAAGALALTGCSGYWKVTDTRYGDAYYTDQKPRANPETGLLRFVDADSGALITLDQFEVAPSTREEMREQAIAGHPEG